MPYVQSKSIDKNILKNHFENNDSSDNDSDNVSNYSSEKTTTTSENTSNSTSENMSNSTEKALKLVKDFRRNNLNDNVSVDSTSEDLSDDDSISTEKALEIVKDFRKKNLTPKNNMFDYIRETRSKYDKLNDLIKLKNKTTNTPNQIDSDEIDYTFNKKSKKTKTPTGHGNNHNQIDSEEIDYMFGKGPKNTDQKGLGYTHGQIDSEEIDYIFGKGHKKTNQHGTGIKEFEQIIENNEITGFKFSSSDKLFTIKLDGLNGLLEFYLKIKIVSSDLIDKIEHSLSGYDDNLFYLYKNKPEYFLAVVKGYYRLYMKKDVIKKLNKNPSKYSKNSDYKGIVQFIKTILEFSSAQFSGYPIKSSSNFDLANSYSSF